VRTDLTEEGANSTLSVAKINKSDSGNYTCSIGPTHSFTTTVHVLNGKEIIITFDFDRLNHLFYADYGLKLLIDVFNRTEHSKASQIMLLQNYNIPFKAVFNANNFSIDL
jgi:hypothetical protein